MLTCANSDLRPRKPAREQLRELVNSVMRTNQAAKRGSTIGAENLAVDGAGEDLRESEGHSADARHEESNYEFSQDLGCIRDGARIPSPGSSAPE